MPIPNQSTRRHKVTYSSQKSDLYVKFREIFKKLLSQTFAFPLPNDADAYVSVNSALEEEILEILQDDESCIKPIVGYRGIGKTALMTAMLKKHYRSNDINTNNIYIYQTPGSVDASWDLLYYCSHERHPTELLQSGLIRILTSRIAAMVEKLCDEFSLEISEEDLDKYIKETKPEILQYANFYDQDDFQQYGRIASKYKIYT